MPLSFTNGDSASTRHPTRCTVMFLTSTWAAYGTPRACVKHAQAGRIAHVSAMRPEVDMRDA